MLTLTTLDLCKDLKSPQKKEEYRANCASFSDRFSAGRSPGCPQLLCLGHRVTLALLSNWEQSYDLQSLRYFSNSYPSYSSLSLFVCTNTEYHRCLYHIRTWTWSLFASRQVHLCLEHRDQPLKALKGDFIQVVSTESATPSGHTLTKLCWTMLHEPNPAFIWLICP